MVSDHSFLRQDISSSKEKSKKRSAVKEEKTVTNLSQRNIEKKNHSHQKKDGSGLPEKNVCQN